VLLDIPDLDEFLITLNVLHDDMDGLFAPAAYAYVRSLGRGREPMPSPILKYFSYERLPEKMQIVSQPFGELAVKMDRELPDGAETSAGLRKLLEAKDCFVRTLLS
jgi:hypothetical protein